jgi:hypothetical protein
VILGKKHFQKKIGFKNANPPASMDQLKDEIKKWPRIGMEKKDES